MPSSDPPLSWFDDADFSGVDADSVQRPLPSNGPEGFTTSLGVSDVPSDRGLFGDPAWQNDPALKALTPEPDTEQTEPTEMTGEAAPHDPAPPPDGRASGTLVLVDGVATVVPFSRSEALVRGFAVVDYDDEPFDELSGFDDPSVHEDPSVPAEFAIHDDPSVPAEFAIHEDPSVPEDLPVGSAQSAPAGHDRASALAWLRQLVPPGSPDVSAPDVSAPESSRDDLRVAAGPPATSAPRSDPDTAVMIRATKLWRTFRKGNRDIAVLRGVDLTVRVGEFVAITGPSGSGKTTLLHCLAGLDDLSHGSVVVDGLELHTLTDAERSRHRSAAMGFAFQSYNLVPSLTALENVELPLMLNDWPQERSEKEARSALELVGLGDRTDFLPDELSGGEQQRIAIARAFVGEPKVVWADEPTGNLDDATAAQVLQVFRELNNSGLTVVMVTHDPAVARLAHRVIELTSGQIHQVNQQVA